MKRLICSIFVSFFLVACGVTGWGFSYGSDYVQRNIVGQTVMVVNFDKSLIAGDLILQIGKWSSKRRFYFSEKSGTNMRYFIVFRESDDCRYSILVDSNGLIKSWRDEDGKTRMTSCYVG